MTRGCMLQGEREGGGEAERVMERWGRGREEVRQRGLRRGGERVGGGEAERVAERWGEGGRR